MLTSIVGINWGDEGKGRMVDLLSEKQDVVVRYQGGNNAGHTVVNHLGKFILNLLPSGILREDVVCVMGTGMVIDIEHLCGEMDRLIAAGVKITPDNLKISDQAQICMPYHVMLDRLEEQRLADKKFGSTGRGISPVYGDKYMKKGIRMGDLLHPRLSAEPSCGCRTVQIPHGGEGLRRGEGDLRSDACLGRKIRCASEALYLRYGTVPRPALKAGKNVMLEAQLGALRDIDFGIYPYTSSSSTIAAYGPVGAGIPNHKLDLSIGIMKAYSSCVGEGPFTVEMKDGEADSLREAGEEYGAATGRPRRVGGFDAVASRYGVRVQGADELALTKLDVLSYLEKIPVCVAYDVDGERVEDFPTGEALNKAKPIFTYLPGWQCDISACRSFGGTAEGSAGLCAVSGKGGRVSCKVRIGGRRAGSVY